MLTMTTVPAATDTDLLRQARAGHADAFAALYRRHQAALYRYALLRCGSADRAADIVQDTFMALLTGGLQYDATRGQLLHYLFGVARILACKRDGGGPATGPELTDDDAPELASDAAGPLERLLGDEAADAVRQALAALAPHYRDVVILYELHDLSYQEIATICQIDLGTVRSRLSRGRAALLKRLAHWRADAA